MCSEEVERLLDRHLEHVGDRLALEAHLERLAVVALAVALLARHVDVGQEVHLDLDLAVAAADLAAPALDVEREAARLVAARPRLLGAREELADRVEQPDVGGRVRPRRAPDRRLVDVDDLVDLVEARDALVRARPLLGPVQPVGDRLVEHLVDQRRLARAGHAGDGSEHAERDLHVDRSGGCAGSRPGSRCSRAGRRRRLRHRDRALARQVLAGERLLDAHHLLGRALGDQPAAVLAGARAEVDQVVGRAHRALVVLDDDHGVAEVAQPLERARSAARCRAGAGRSTARRGCRARRPGSSRSASPAGSAGPRRPTAWPPRARATGSRRRRCRGSAAARRSRAGSAARSGARCRSARASLEPLDRPPRRHRA